MTVHKINFKKPQKTQEHNLLEEPHEVGFAADRPVELSILAHQGGRHDLAC